MIILCAISVVFLGCYTFLIIAGEIIFPRQLIAIKIPSVLCSCFDGSHGNGVLYALRGNSRVLVSSCPDHRCFLLQNGEKFVRHQK